MVINIIIIIIVRYRCWSSHSPPCRGHTVHYPGTVHTPQGSNINLSHLTIDRSLSCILSLLTKGDLIQQRDTYSNEPLSTNPLITIVHFFVCSYANSRLFYSAMDTPACVMRSQRLNTISARNFIMRALFTNPLIS